MAKIHYEVVGKTYSSMRSIEEAKKDNDLESFHYIDADGYRDAVKKAKMLSKKIGEIIRGDFGTKELVEVCVMCYEDNDITSYDQQWEERYENGKKQERYYWND